MKHGIQEAFSHSASCITPEVLIESFSIPFGCLQLAVGTSPDGQVVPGLSLCPMHSFTL